MNEDIVDVALKDHLQRKGLVDPKRGAKPISKMDASSALGPIMTDPFVPHCFKPPELKVIGEGASEGSADSGRDNVETSEDGD